MRVELVCATGVAGRAPAQVRRALPNREVEALDERRVQGLGILDANSAAFSRVLPSSSVVTPRLACT